VSAVLIDTNILLDIFTDDPNWYEWSINALSRAARDSTLIISPVIYAELSIEFETPDSLDTKLADYQVEHEETSRRALFLDGRAFAHYRKREGAKTSPLPDFFIGAHAQAAGYPILTRDTHRYRYFPDVRLIAPQASEVGGSL
jgi:predicted nucleic acid-binding protein